LPTTHSCRLERIHNLQFNDYFKQRSNCSVITSQCACV